MALGLGLGLGLTRAAGGLSPFTISKYVAIGASLTDQSFAPSIGRSLCNDIARELYGKSVAVTEEAIAGQGVASQLTSIASILSGYTGDSDVIFVDHIGGNDITVGTEFTDLSGATQTQLTDDYNSIWDAVEADGHKFLPCGLTFRNYSGTTLDNDPDATKANELNGSFTYNEDWIKIVASRGGNEVVNLDKLVVTQYEYVRSVEDIFLEPDNLHPDVCGQLMFPVNQFIQVMELSEGRYPALPEEVNFNNAFLEPVAHIDLILSVFGGTQVDTTTNDRINYLSVPSGNSYKEILADNLINTDKSNAVGVSILISSANKSFSTGAGLPSDTSASLDNSEIREGRVSITGSGASVGAVVFGLEANRLYEVSFCNGIFIDTLGVANTAGAGVAPDAAGTNLFSTRADPFGRILIGNKENSAGNSAGFSAIRVRSVPDQHFVFSFDATPPVGTNINYGTTSSGTNSAIIDVDGNSLASAQVDWAGSGTDSAGSGNTGDNSDTVYNDDLQSNSISKSGAGVKNIVNITGLPANRDVSIGFVASIGGAGDRQQSVITKNPDTGVETTQVTGYQVFATVPTVETFDAATDVNGEIDIITLETNGDNSSYFGGFEIKIWSA